MRKRSRTHNIRQEHRLAMPYDDHTARATLVTQLDESHSSDQMEVKTPDVWAPKAETRLSKKAQMLGYRGTLRMRMMTW